MDKKLILVAEDEAPYRNVLKRVLEEVGYSVGLAADGEELLKAARAKKPALIILDLLMPVKNGYQVLTEMKADPNLKDIKTIVLSNRDLDEDVEKIKKLGVDDYFIKSEHAIEDLMQRIKLKLKENGGDRA
jgi:CheY-like chemotaxis protein